jgi:hypothetical protein
MRGIFEGGEKQLIIFYGINLTNESELFRRRLVSLSIPVREKAEQPDFPEDYCAGIRHAE